MVLVLVGVFGVVVLVVRSTSDKGKQSTRWPVAHAPSPSASPPHPANPFANGTLSFDTARAKKGHALFDEIIARYPQLDSLYRNLDTRSVASGFGAFISIPEEEWGRLTEAQRSDLGHWMSSASPNGWAIHVGRVSGADVMSDRNGLDSKSWLPSQ